MNETLPIPTARKGANILKYLRPTLGAIILIFIVYRLSQVLFIQQTYGPETWTRLIIAGLIIGSVYALIAIGYTLVYGILFMINFAHGEVMMFGAYTCFYVFEAFKNIKVGNDPALTFSNAYRSFPSLLPLCWECLYLRSRGTCWKRSHTVRCEKHRAWCP
jgi:ABC-type branched-subunit amino acid transport system permease subunit